MRDYTEPTKAEAFTDACFDYPEETDVCWECGKPVSKDKHLCSACM